MLVLLVKNLLRPRAVAGDFIRFSRRKVSEAAVKSYSRTKMDSSMTGNDLRQLFIDFYVKKHQHTFSRSSSVIPHDDPTLLFANAGMNQVSIVLINAIHREN